MRLLDLFCGAGGCSVGYKLAGFTDITGVDRSCQSNYPFKFIQADWSNINLNDYDFIHASPPCQEFVPFTKLNRSMGRYDYHQDLINPVRDALIKSGKPYVIENVMKAPLNNPIILCGNMFDLRTYRHRKFETSFPVLQPKHKKHDRKIGAINKNNGFNQHGIISVFGHFSAPLEYARFALGINWMSRKELSQAIPPTYTEYIGRQYLKRRR